MAVFIYVYRYIINSRDRLSFDIFNFLVHLIQCKMTVVNVNNVDVSLSFQARLFIR